MSLKCACLAIPPPKSSDERGPSDHSVDRQLPERHETVSQVEMPTIPEAPARPPVAEGRPADFREMIHLLTQLHSALAEGVMEAVCLYDETNPAHFVLLPQLIEVSDSDPIFQDDPTFRSESSVRPIVEFLLPAFF